jgi:hypothetical protein
MPVLVEHGALSLALTSQFKEHFSACTNVVPLGGMDLASEGPYIFGDAACH